MGPLLHGVNNLHFVFCRGKGVKFNDLGQLLLLQFHDKLMGKVSNVCTILQMHTHVIHGEMCGINFSIHHHHLVVLISQ